MRPGAPSALPQGQQQGDDWQRYASESRRRELVMGKDGQLRTVMVKQAERGDGKDESDSDDGDTRPKERGLVTVSRGAPGARIVHGGASGVHSSLSRDGDVDSGGGGGGARPATHASPTTLRYLHGHVLGSGSDVVIKQKAVLSTLPPR